MNEPTSTQRKTAMSDKYQEFTTSAIGRLLVKNLGLPAHRSRWEQGRALARAED